jgi:8-oxo-dGTP pyrophosphatase MutT (NUDIX family)
MSEVFPAATVVLVRDNQKTPAQKTLEVLLMRRSQQVSFASDSWVFPGGRIDRDDYGSELTDIEAAARCGAVRETLEEAALEIDEKSLFYFAHRTTPPKRPKRFATWFYLGEVDNTQQVIVDGSEIIDHQWRSPSEALNEFHQQSMKMLPPTVLMLTLLANCQSVAEAFAACKTSDTRQFLPQCEMSEQGMVMEYPLVDKGDQHLAVQSSYLLAEPWRLEL